MTKLKQSSLALSLLAISILSFVVPNMAFAASQTTLNVVSNSTEATYHDAVVKSADRLVSLQNTNGSWDWIVTGATGPTSGTYLNITGVTAQGLLSAYSITGDQAYLDAAKKAGDFIISNVDASSPKNINGYNVLFLQKLSTALEDPSYAAKAAEYFGDLFTAQTTICPTGCVDTAGLVAGQMAKRSVTTTPDGIVLWDLVSYVEYSNLVGDTTHANAIGGAIIATATDPSYVNSVSNYDLGLVSALKAATLIGDSTNAATLKGLLTADTTPRSVGSFGLTTDGKIQVTSYALRALNLSSDPRASDAATYIVNSAIPTGGWVDTDSNEYSEVDGEATTALVDLLPSSIQYYSLSDAVAAASDGDTIVLGTDATTTSQVTINKAITLDGNGHTLNANFTKVDNSNNSAIGIQHNDVVIKNLTLDGKSGGQTWPTQLHGVNVYLSTNVKLDAVTISNFGGSGIVVNGSDVSATNLTTSGNVWNSVNVDPGSGVIVPSVFTLTSGTLADATQIWSDGGHVTAAATVTVNAPGYNMYSTVDPAGILWTSKPVANAAAITRGGISTLYPTIQAAITAASTTVPETVVLLGNSTTTAQIIIDRALTIDGQGFTLNAFFTKTDNSNNSVIGINHSDVTIKNLFEDGTSGVNLHGINIFQSSDINLNDVTVSHNGHAGITVDGSVVTVNNIATANNGWGGINVDQGPGVTATSTYPATLIVNGISSHTETNAAIWVDDNSKTFVSVVDTNNQYNSAPYVHDTNITGTNYILKPLLSSIAITTLATKLTYAFGNTLDTTGLVVTGTYSDATTAIVAPVVVTGFDGNTAGSQILTVSFGGKTTTYTVNVADNPTIDVSSNGGGGGGGGGYYVPATSVPPVAPTVIDGGCKLGEKFSTVTGKLCTTNTTPQGQVLGATAFNFTLTLSLGSRGDEVTQLQNRLISEGLLSTGATGYFGKLTQDAVKAYQTKNGIPATGVVGPMTRNALNALISGSTGAVLGATTFNFTLTLSLGSRGNEVTQLQTRLSTEGLLSTEATGYFGKLTQDAVKTYQTKNNIPATGVVGALTRAALNK